MSSLKEQTFLFPGRWAKFLRHARFWRIFLKTVPAKFNIQIEAKIFNKIQITEFTTPAAIQFSHKIYQDFLCWGEKKISVEINDSWNDERLIFYFYVEKREAKIATDDLWDKIWTEVGLIKELEEIIVWHVAGNLRNR